MLDMSQGWLFEDRPSPAGHVPPGRPDWKPALRRPSAAEHKVMVLLDVLEAHDILAKDLGYREWTLLLSGSPPFAGCLLPPVAYVIAQEAADACAPVVYLPFGLQMPSPMWWSKVRRATIATILHGRGKLRDSGPAVPANVVPDVISPYSWSIAHLRTAFRPGTWLYRGTVFPPCRTTYDLGDDDSARLAVLATNQRIRAARCWHGTHAARVCVL